MSSCPMHNLRANAADLVDNREHPNKTGSILKLCYLVGLDSLSWATEQVGQGLGWKQEVYSLPRNSGPIERWANSRNYYKMGGLQFLDHMLSKGRPGEYYKARMFPIFHRCMLEVADPDLIKQILRRPKNGLEEEDVFFGGDEFDTIGAAIGHHTILTTGGGERTHLRKAALNKSIGGQFSIPCLKDAFTQFQAISRRFVRDLPRGEEVNMSEVIPYFVGEALAEVIMGKGAFDERVPEAVVELENIVSNALTYQLQMPLKVNQAFKKQRQTLLDAVARVTQAAQDREAGLIADMKASGDYTPEQIGQMAFLTFFVGQGTTMRSLISACFRLEKGIQEKLHEEISSKVTDQEITHDLLQELHYLDAFYKENLRMAPPVWAQPRTAIRDFELQVEGDKPFKVPAETLVIVNHFAANRDGSRWKDPLTFNPDRFFDEEQKNNWLQPFGWGANRCIGQHFASYAAKVFLIELVKQTRIHVLNESEPPQKAGFSLAYTEDIRVRLESR